MRLGQPSPPYVMITPKRKTGDLGEKIARKYLKKNGYKILDRNYQKKWGEIDIIARKDGAIIFIEVKTMETGSRYGLPEEKVDYWKTEKLLRTAELYLIEKNYPEDSPWQIDLISVELNWLKRKANLRHLKEII